MTYVKFSAADPHARRIICAEPAKQRQAIARDSGADDIVNPMKEDVAEACLKLTDVSASMGLIKLDTKVLMISYRAEEWMWRSMRLA